MGAGLLAGLLWMGVALPAAGSEMPDSTDRPTTRRERTTVTVPDSSRQTAVTVVDMAGDTLRMSQPLQGVDGIEILADSTGIRPNALGRVRTFNPDPNRALWLSALCPGLGQAYNRRYWKLPIVVGAFVGLSYGTSWNNRMLKDYTRAYRDAMDDDPDTRSYMNFYPPTTQESDLDMAWLQKSLKNKKIYYRRYRDICILSMVGVYLINLVDAYVDASLAHFDISPDLSLQVAPAVEVPDLGAQRKPTLGLSCAIQF